MSETLHATLTAVLVIFLLLGVGAGVRRLQWLTEHADETLMRLLVRLLLPALILDVVVGNERLLGADSVLLPPVVGAAGVALGFGLSLLAARGLHRRVGLPDGRAQRTFALCTGLQNYGYIPLPLVTVLFDRGTLGVLFLHNLGVELALWTLGIVLVSGGLGRGWWRRLLNGPILAIVGGLLLNFSGAAPHLPDFLTRAVGMLGACTIPTALLLTGAIVADRAREARFGAGARTMATACALRLGVLPAAFLLLAWALPGPEELRRVVVIEAAMPAAVFPIVLSRFFGGSVPTAMRVVLATTLLSLITMPLWVAAGLALL
jgi:predicted permease